MSGIYIHIPFCKKACHYCDFHFSTSLKYKEQMITAICDELELRKEELKINEVATIYFGGGTPSLLEVDEIERILTVIENNFNVVKNPEITLEANPDDLSEQKIIALSATPINRLSIGVQSFFDKELKMMNRAHNASEVENCLKIANQYFDNITIDLMYGIPGLTHDEWRANIKKALLYGVTHISSYALTVEEGTALHHFVKENKYPPVDEEHAAEQFDILVEELAKAGFQHYEISNFGKPDYFSKHNTSYWLGKSYLGIGPSAHSFNGRERGWNVANNQKYIKAIQERLLPLEMEILTELDRYNEYIMTGLRTIWGVSLLKIEQDFGNEVVEVLKEQVSTFVNQGLLFVEEGCLKTTQKGKFLADGIASELFRV